MSTIYVAGKSNKIVDILSRSFRDSHRWNCPDDLDFLTRFHLYFPLPQGACWQLFMILSYARDFNRADAAIANGHMEITTKERTIFLNHWCGYVGGGGGVDPYLAGEDFETIFQAVSGFGGRVRRGYYGRDRQVTCA